MITIHWPDIIVLNGSSSAGKSTLAKAMQDAFAHPYLHLGFDTFVMMAPRRYWGNSDSPEQTDHSPELSQGVTMVARQAAGEPKKIEAVFGPVFRSIIDAIPLTVATLAQAGNSVIFDHVYHDPQMVSRAQECFAGLNVFHLGVYCPLDELERRERARGDRVIGRTRGLYDIVHNLGVSYDLTVDTSQQSTNEIISQVLRAFEK